MRLDRTGVFFRRHQMMLGMDSVYTIEDHDQKTMLFPKHLGYALGARGRWRVYDGSLDDYRNQWGKLVGTVKTLDEAARLLREREEA
jgi:hypothetical protein